MDRNAWTQESAIAELTRLYDWAHELVGSTPGDEGLVQWMLTTRRVMSEVFGEASSYFVSFAALRWNATPSGAIGGPGRPDENFHPEIGIERLEKAHIARCLSAALGIVAAALDELSSSDIRAVFHGKDTGPEASAILTVVHLAEHKLRKTMRSEPSREKEVQDRFEDLLNGVGIDFTRETEQVTYSSKNYIPDFVLQHADLAVEIKFCAREGREKELVAEINDDIMAYQQKWGNLLFVVYDVGYIRDVDLFTGEFESDVVLVHVVKH